MNWKHACKSDLERLTAIEILFGRNRKLVDFLFHPVEAKLSASAESLKRKMNCFSSGEQILLLIAMDIWGTYGGIHFDDLYSRLDPQSFTNCIKALAYIKQEKFLLTTGPTSDHCKHESSEQINDTN